jgi:hypothetical protein
MKIPGKIVPTIEGCSSAPSALVYCAVSEKTPKMLKSASNGRNDIKSFII